MRESNYYVLFLFFYVEILVDIHVKLGDFGIARALSSRADLASTMAGTPLYLAPEVCRGEPYGPPADLWALGCLLHELASLAPPFSGSSLAAVVRGIVTGARAPLPPSAAARYSPALLALIDRLLDPVPARRPTLKELFASDALVRESLSDIIASGALTEQDAERLAKGAAAVAAFGGDLRSVTIKVAPEDARPHPALGNNKANRGSSITVVASSSSSSSGGDVNANSAVSAGSEDEGNDDAIVNQMRALLMAGTAAGPFLDTDGLAAAANTSNANDKPSSGNAPTGVITDGAVRAADRHGAGGVPKRTMGRWMMGKANELDSMMGQLRASPVKSPSKAAAVEAGSVGAVAKKGGVRPIAYNAPSANNSNSGSEGGINSPAAFADIFAAAMAMNTQKLVSSSAEAVAAANSSENCNVSEDGIDISFAFANAVTGPLPPGLLPAAAAAAAAANTSNGGNGSKNKAVSGGEIICPAGPAEPDEDEQMAQIYAAFCSDPAKARAAAAGAAAPKRGAAAGANAKLAKASAAVQGRVAAPSGKARAKTPSASAASAAAKGKGRTPASTPAAAAAAAAAAAEPPKQKQFLRRGAMVERYYGKKAGDSDATGDSTASDSVAAASAAGVVVTPMLGPKAAAAAATPSPLPARAAPATAAAAAAPAPAARPPLRAAIAAARKNAAAATPVASPALVDSNSTESPAPAPTRVRPAAASSRGDIKAWKRDMMLAAAAAKSNGSNSDATGSAGGNGGEDAFEVDIKVSGSPLPPVSVNSQSDLSPSRSRSQSGVGVNALDGRASPLARLASAGLHIDIASTAGGSFADSPFPDSDTHAGAGASTNTHSEIVHRRGGTGATDSDYGGVTPFADDRPLQGNCAGDRDAVLATLPEEESLSAHGVVLGQRAVVQWPLPSARNGDNPYGAEESNGASMLAPGHLAHAQSFAGPSPALGAAADGDDESEAARAERVNMRAARVALLRRTATDRTGVKATPHGSTPAAGASAGGSTNARAVVSPSSAKQVPRSPSNNAGVGGTRPGSVRSPTGVSKSGSFPSASANASAVAGMRRPNIPLPAVPTPTASAGSNASRPPLASGARPLAPSASAAVLSSGVGANAHARALAPSPSAGSLMAYRGGAQPVLLHSPSGCLVKTDFAPPTPSNRFASASGFGSSPSPTASDSTASAAAAMVAAGMSPADSAAAAREAAFLAKVAQRERERLAKAEARKSAAATDSPGAPAPAVGSVPRAASARARGSGAAVGSPALAAPGLARMKSDLTGAAATAGARPARAGPSPGPAPAQGPMARVPLPQAPRGGIMRTQVIRKPASEQ